jgi:hypothetical protein
MDYQKHQHIHGAMPRVIKLLLLNRTGDRPADRVSPGASKPATYGRFKTSQPWIVESCSQNPCYERGMSLLLPTPTPIYPSLVFRAHAAKDRLLTFQARDNSGGPGSHSVFGSHLVFRAGGRYGWF